MVIFLQFQTPKSQRGCSINAQWTRNRQEALHSLQRGIQCCVPFDVCCLYPACAPYSVDCIRLGYYILHTISTLASYLFGVYLKRWSRVYYSSVVSYLGMIYLLRRSSNLLIQLSISTCSELIYRPFQVHCCAAHTKKLCAPHYHVLFQYPSPCSPSPPLQFTHEQHQSGAAQIIHNQCHAKQVEMETKVQKHLPEFECSLFLAFTLGAHPGHCAGPDDRLAWLVPSVDVDTSRLDADLASLELSDDPPP